MSLDTYLRTRPGRCAGFGYHETQGCSCEGSRLKHAGQSAALDARPDDRAKVDAAIRQLAATGREFSSNDARSIHGVKGAVVGAAFGAAARSGLIRSVGAETSSGRSAHGKDVAVWIGTDPDG